MQFLCEEIKCDGEKRQHQSLRGDDGGIILSEEKMQDGKKGHIERAGRNAAKIVRADQQALGEVVIKARVGIWKRHIRGRGNGRVEAILQNVHGNAEPEDAGSEIEEEGMSKLK